MITSPCDWIHASLSRKYSNSLTYFAPTVLSLPSSKFVVLLFCWPRRQQPYPNVIKPITPTLHNNIIMSSWCNLFNHVKHFCISKPVRRWSAPVWFGWDFSHVSPEASDLKLELTILHLPVLQYFSSFFSFWSCLSPSYFWNMQNTRSVERGTKENY